MRVTFAFHDNLTNTAEAVEQLEFSSASSCFRAGNGNFFHVEKRSIDESDSPKEAIELMLTLAGDTFSLDVGEGLASQVDPDRLLVAESGLYSHADLERMARAGARAFLIGESLMRQDDVTTATRTILGLSAPDDAATPDATSRAAAQ